MTPKNNIIKKTNNIYLDDLIKKLLIEKPFDENINNCRISWEDYFNHNFFKNPNKIEIENDSINKGIQYKINKKKIILEGEDLNEKKLNGKGKEFYSNSDELNFEGEYINGERNGKGKEYYYNGELKFEGEYLNGERNEKCILL